MDVGDLPNHVKYCISVLSLQWATIRPSPVGIPQHKIHINTHKNKSTKLASTMEKEFN